MDIKYEVGICSHCGNKRLITHKSKKLCESCRQKTKTKVTLKRTPIKKTVGYKIPRQSEKGRVKKQKEVDYYKTSWKLKEDWKGGNLCEECRVYLPSYKSNYISHILSRGSHPELALHPLNHNILCSGIGYKDCHGKWENGDKSSMLIFNKNQLTIAKMQEDLQAGKNFCSSAK